LVLLLIELEEELNLPVDLNVIVVACVVLTLNVLDSVTTALCFKQYPDKELKGESNPLMRVLMLKSRVLAEVVKQGVVLAVVIYLVVNNDIVILRLACIMLGLVVMNNTYVVVSRAITKRRTVAPFKKLINLLRIPDKYAYVIILVILVGLAWIINVVVWG